MKKYSLPVRAAALVCALCLLLTGCGKAAAPDEPGKSSTFAPTAEPAATTVPAAEETQTIAEDPELTDVEMKAVQLAAEHLGKDTALTDVADFSAEDFEGEPLSFC